MLRQIEALEIGNQLLKQHGLSNIWKIEFNKSPTKLGSCWFDSKVIAISVHLLNSTSEAQFRDTFLHEIAHALVGYEHGHDEIWRMKAIEIGSTGNITGEFNPELGRQTSSSETKPKVHIAPLTKKCVECGKVAIEKFRFTTKSGETRIILECKHVVSQGQLDKTFSFPSWESMNGKKLFPFQIKGAEFIEKSNGRCLIADEPGLGKTVQAISFLKAHPEISLPVLWVCKTTLKIQAFHEIVEWTDLSYLPCIIESAKSFILPNMKVYITSMDLLRKLKTETIEKLGIKTIIADEIQHFKNPDATRTQELRRLVNKVDFFIALSGTPWKNRGSEYFPVLNMLDPQKFPSYAHFVNKWVDVYEDKATGKFKQGGIRNIEKFREYTKDIVIRRMRQDVLPDLPKINRTIRYVELESIYGESYERAEKQVAAIIKDIMLEGRNNQQLASELMKLKHITGLAKVDAQVEDAIEFLEDTEEWEKITIFHHHIDVGNEIEKKLNNWLASQGLNKCLRLLGGRGAEERNETIEAFKKNIKNRVLIASTLASGEGLNIQFCQNASMMERQWNPANEEQAELRFSRPITKKDLPDYLQHLGDATNVSIRVPYLICAGTVDEMLTSIVERKRLHFQKAMNVGQEDLAWSDMDMINELSKAIIEKRYGKRDETKRNEIL